MISITIIDPNGRLHQLSFDEAGVGVGRALDNQLVLPAGQVSNHHCRITLRDGKLVVTDTGSSNGTFVNGIRLSNPILLRAVDRLTVGPYSMTVEKVEPPPQPAVLEIDAMPTPPHLRPSHVHHAAQRAASPVAAAPAAQGPPLSLPEASPVPRVIRPGRPVASPGLHAQATQPPRGRPTAPGEQAKPTPASESPPPDSYVSSPQIGRRSTTARYGSTPQKPFGRPWRDGRTELVAPVSEAATDPDPEPVPNPEPDPEAR